MSILFWHPLRTLLEARRHRQTANRRGHAVRPRRGGFGAVVIEQLASLFAVLFDDRTIENLFLTACKQAVPPGKWQSMTPVALEPLAALFRHAVKKDIASQRVPKKNRHRDDSCKELQRLVCLVTTAHGSQIGSIMPFPRLSVTTQPSASLTDKASCGTNIDIPSDAIERTPCVLSERKGMTSSPRAAGLSFHPHPKVKTPLVGKDRP